MSTQSSSSVVPRTFPLLLGALVALAGFAQQAAGQDGWTVTWASAGQNGKEVSQFHQNGPKNWYEMSSTGGGTFPFEETGRDDTSVYLYDASRKMKLQIDLQSGKIYYSDANNSRAALYDILRSSTYANGWVLRSATYGGDGKRMGDFLQTGNKTWREVPSSGGKTFDFTETKRESWSVYLYDASRNMKIHIDLQNRKISYSDANNPQSALYDVLYSSAQANGRLVQFVKYGQGGRSQGEYRQTGDRMWQEVPASGSGYSFNEAGRDDWSVYLDDPARNVRIQIDLQRRKIYYTDANNPRRELYDVLGAY